jgi:hypothetical protein
LGALLSEALQDDASARELYTSWDIEKDDIGDVYRVAYPLRMSSAHRPFAIDEIDFEVVVVLDSCASQLGHFIRIIGSQRSGASQLELFVAVTSEHFGLTSAISRVRSLYASVAKFVSADDLWNELSGAAGNDEVALRPFIVVSGSSCVPPHDWLETLSAYIATYPEVEVFSGSCRPRENVRAGFVERLAYELGLFPHSAEYGGLLRFTGAGGWACTKDVLDRARKLEGKERDAQVLDVQRLTRLVLEAGGSKMHAADWISWFKMDSTILDLVRRFWRDGYNEGAVRRSRVERNEAELNRRLVVELYWSAQSIIKFTLDNFKVWRFDKRSLFYYAPAFVLLLIVGLARRVGFIVALKQFARKACAKT